MEFAVGDRVAVVTYPEAEFQFAGTVTAVTDESATHDLEIGCECAYDVRPDGEEESRHVLAAYVIPGPDAQ